MNKIFSKIIVLTLALATVMSLSACAGENSSGVGTEENKVVILCADFAEYDWARCIASGVDGRIEIRLLNETGTDMHSFQPSVKDMASIAECDLLIYTDGISEFWMDEALEASGKESLNELSLMEAFIHSSLKEQYDLSEYKDGNEAEGEEEEHHHEVDEHLWTSVKLAEYFTTLIEKKMEELDPENRESYRSNMNDYLERLKQLDGEYEEFSASLSDNTVLLCDRYPFFYLSQDTGFSFCAAFEGCDADAEAGFDVIVRLAKVLEDKKLSSVFVLENSGDDLAEAVIRAAEDDDSTIHGDEIEIYTLNSMQSISLADMENGADYISIMRKNLETLKQAKSR